MTVGPTTTTVYFIYDGEKPILEYKAADGSLAGKNVYGKGIDEWSDLGCRDIDGPAR